MHRRKPGVGAGFPEPADPADRALCGVGERRCDRPANGACLIAGIGAAGDRRKPPGAGGALGLIALSKTPADGYTIALTGTTTLTIVPILFPKMATYNPKEFAPISLVSEAPLLLVLGPATSVKTVKELIELAKAKPGTLTMGSAGNGTTNHLVGELFKANAGIDFVHVPYKGSGEALNDLIGGHIDFIFDQIPASIGFVKAGTARALGLTLAQRSPILPEIPTFAEQGWPDVQASTTLGMVAPAATPPAVVDKLSGAIARALNDQKTREAIALSGAQPLGSTPDQFRQRLDHDLGVWTRVIAKANIKIEQ